VAEILEVRTLSGMRPTGPLHIGHYFGALKNWVELQHSTRAIFFVADWHALTSDFADSSRLREYTQAMLTDWLACGLDPQICTLFRQSSVLQHAELHLLLSMITPISWLERNPTYKEQQQEITTKDLGNYGFLGYPVLQAADILIYRPKWVPVGQDQLPHLELTREIARRFNFMYGQFFPEPEAHLTPAAKCPGLDGRKMSKSYGNSVYLADSVEDVAAKVKNMFTDPARLRKSDPGNPDVCNLYPYHELLTDDDTRATIRQGCATAALGCVDCKKIFIKGLEDFLAPIHERRRQYADRPDIVQDILNEGSNRARVLAENTMQQVRSLMHF
jgi:tryptophanyl-tRNA synthetase